MAHPARNAASANILNPSRIFFATTKAAMGKRILQSERNAGLLVDVLRSLVAERKFELHDFVIMPDHLHVLLTVYEEMTIEKAMQLIKGRFSHRMSHEFEYTGEVWQRGFTEVQVMNKKAFEAHRAYIAENPIKAGLVTSVCGPAKAVPLLQSKVLRRRKWQRRKAKFVARLKPCPCYKARF